HELRLVAPIGDQATTRGIETKRIDRWQIEPRSRRNDQIAFSRSKRAWGYNEAATGFLREVREGALDVGVIAQAGPCRGQPYSAGSSYDHAEECEVRGYFRNVNDRYSTHRRCDLLEHLQPFAAKRGFEIVEPRNMPVRMRQARDITASYRVGHPREDDRDCGSRLHYGRDDRVGGDEDHIRHKSH